MNRISVLTAFTVWCLGSRTTFCVIGQAIRRRLNRNWRVCGPEKNQSGVKKHLLSTYKGIHCTFCQLVSDLGAVFRCDYWWQADEICQLAVSHCVHCIVLCSHYIRSRMLVSALRTGMCAAYWQVRSVLTCVHCTDIREVIFSCTWFSISPFQVSC